MPRQLSPNVEGARSISRQFLSSLAPTVPADPAETPPPQPIQSVYPIPGELPFLSQPTYSQTILQAPTLATDSSSLPPQPHVADLPSGRSRRHSSSSMRNASTTFEHVAPASTPTGRVSKAKKGKRVHACEFPGCGKVFTRAEHRRRHELNHNPDAVFRCQQPSCGKAFHRLDLLQRHQERHETEASPSLSASRPQHSNIYTSPPSVLPSTPLVRTASENVSRTTSSGVSIGSLIHHPQSQYNTSDPTLGFGTYMPTFSHAVDPYYYGSEGSHSPASDHFGRAHRPSISSASSVIAFEPHSTSPNMSALIPGTWIPSVSTPPVALTSSAYDDGQVPYLSSSTVNPVPQHLRELDGHEFATIQRELSMVPGLIFDSPSPELPRYIRFDCLELYWKYFHPSFPIVYKPNFVTNTPPPLLLSAVLATGSFYDSRPDARLYSLALQEIATKLLRQRENITAKSRIADLQTVLLLEILSRYCARHTSPATSARFRALFASLHETRQKISQNSLSVFKTLKATRTDNDLKRAHTFWLENEARRRIFHACSILDMQQVVLFGERPTIITHVPAVGQDFNAQEGLELPCGEALWNCPFEEWAANALIASPMNISTARKNYRTTTLDDFSFFQHQIIYANSTAPQRCLDEECSPTQGSGLLGRTRFNYHVFQMAKYMPVRAILAVAGDSWLLGKKIESESDYDQAKSVVREWVNMTKTATPSEQVADFIRAHWHALKVLRTIINLEDKKAPFRTTHMLHEDWAVYLATLVCWIRGYGHSGKVQSTVRAAPTLATNPLPAAEKRKATQEDTPSRKRQAHTQPFSNTLFAPSSAARAIRIPHSIPTTLDDTPTWFTYGHADPIPSSWNENAYYDPLLAYHAHSDSASTAESSVYTISTPATGLTRTATNTPQSQSSRATTAATVHLPPTDGAIAELRTYLALTDVPTIKDLEALDPSILGRTRGVLDAIRIYKIGAKRIVGGLMNDAEQVLARLAEGRNMF
ncbi:hypothetical protein LTR05_007111 [Lithohypha guttulata]|uniref:C2H2-type domain-containing protein n=1 Tax=Lithohypha guttulata TaxID=1690604 RepID=A0AAN7YDM9_9EURO|nr:hypothetical protein LTR05_007111 [Lithohypha guttulata]